MAADEKLNEMYGIKPPTGAAPQKPQEPGIADPASVGAKVLQSATFGFGADVAGAVFGKQSEVAIRGLEQNYDKAHPLASMGIDLAVGIAQAAATGGGSTALTGAKAIAKGVAMGAGYGALSGAGSGGSLEDRADKALKQGAVGAVAGGALGAVANAAKPLAEKMGFFSSDKAGAEKIMAALKKDGKTPQELESFMKQNPDARIADFSPAVADLAGEAGGSTQKAARTLGTNVREDVSQQQGRLQTQSTPLQNVKDQYAANLKGLEQQRKQAYDTAYSEVVPVSPELKAALSHPDVEPLVKQALSDYATKRMNPKDIVSQAPKYAVGKELPTAVIDDVQKALGDAARDPAAMGKMKAGAFQTLQGLLKDTQPATLDRAQRLAAMVGGEESKSGIIGAQTWGSQFAFGLKTADIQQWRSMDPLQKQYARIGMTDGMERYLTDAGSMGEARLRKIGEKLGSDPQIREVLGDKEANQMKKVFIKEADRARTSQTMASGGSKRAQWQEDDMDRKLAHMANVGIPGAHSVVGTAVRVLKSMGMPEARSIAIINQASKPGGLAALQKAGMDQKTLDKVAQLVGNKGVGARMAEQENAKSER